MGGFEEISVELSDGYAAYARFWEATPPCGAVLYHHGIQSHCGWYESSARALVKSGFSVLQVDRRGSGRNEQDRGAAGSADQLQADATSARDELLRRTGFDSFHVVGVSWGGKLAVYGYLMDPTGVLSLSLVTPGLFPLVGASAKTMQEIGFAMLYEPESRFAIPLNEPELFTADETWRDFFRNDKYTLRECTAGFYLASRRMDKPLAKLAQQIPVPIHLMLVGKEHIIDNDKTQAFFDTLQWPSYQSTVYEGALHSIEFEEERSQFFDDLARFMVKANNQDT